MGIRPEFIKALELVSSRENPTVVEIGSHKGDGIKLMRDLLDSPTIIGIEPSPENFKVLLKTVKVNVYNCAIGKENGFALIKTEVDKTRERSRNSNIFNEDGYKVEMFTLDKFLSDNEIKKVDFLRFDCYFSEYEIFKAKTLNFLKITDIIYIAMHFKGTEMKIKEVYAKRDFIKNKLKDHGFSKADGAAVGCDKHIFQVWRKL